jgi:lantibiotic transport system permease protein
MKENDFLKKMENLQKPEVNADASRKQVKLAIMNARKSAAWGVWFLVVPILFFVSIPIKELFHWKVGISENIINWMTRLDKSPSTGWLTPVLLVLLPAVGAVVNLLAIMHFVYDKVTKELVVTIKMKWFNIVLAIISIAIVGTVILYGLMETSAERAIHRMEMKEN